MLCSLPVRCQEGFYVSHRVRATLDGLILDVGRQKRNNEPGEWRGMINDGRDRCL